MARQKRREFKKELPCELTPVERDAKAKMLSQTLAKLDSIKAEKKAAMSDFNTRIKDQESALSMLREQYDSGKEPRTVKCVEFITDHGTIEVERTDTGEVVESRRAVSSELQMDLPDKATPAEKAAAAALGAPKKPKKARPPKAPKKPKAPKGEK